MKNVYKILVSGKLKETDRLGLMGG